MSDRISQAEYSAAFDGKTKEALKHALDIRKFEIDLYWKRAAYFWTFIGATLVGYSYVQASSLPHPEKTDLSVALPSLGIVFSFGWFCVNKGSKHWQENWENHVDMLEDSEIGPLYKVVLTRPEQTGWKRLEELITGPSSLSVSKINQIISLFVTVLWLFLLCRVLTFSTTGAINWKYVLIIGAAVVSCVGFLTLGRTYRGRYIHWATKRKTEIDPVMSHDNG